MPTRCSRPLARRVRAAGTAAATVLTALVLSAPPALAAPPGPPEPRDPVTDGADGADGADSISSLLARLRVLYTRAESASEAYNATAERLKRQRAAAARATSALSRAHSELARSRAVAGRLAREQYRGAATGLPIGVRVLLARDPYGLLERGHLLQRAVGEQAAAVRRLTTDERRRSALAARARTALDRQQRLTDRRRDRRDAARDRLDEVEALLASLSPEEVAELRGLEDERTAEAQRELLGSGALGGGAAPAARAPSAPAREALRYALRQRGKPYRWGADGPGSFDSSGLAARAWQHADRKIPRTAQGQWRRLKRVPLRELRPGDLVVYFPGATHVALYAGGGKVVEASRPGDVVKVSPLAAHPLRGAVRVTD
ncbi:C40 family peptidase [Streptomyces boncukensis]|uniref:C40 family peptidase n=1 Tax=Streptomyces boncukensis TaxID=2711219 RepID=A0A6G4WY61_9ACTN|nr:C40 family peptidase [Streptomyces boncukensis]NGO69802.1 C40 family peptidase [Streptomyces boncukensis]